MTDHVYKVCYKQFDGKYFKYFKYLSYIASVVNEHQGRVKDDNHLLEKWVVEYKIDKVARPALNSKGLYAFKTSKSAFEWIRWLGFQFVVLECEYKPLCISFARVSAISFTEIKDFWRGYDSKSVRLGQLAPDDTIVCKWLKPIRKVWL